MKYFVKVILILLSFLSEISAQNTIGTLSYTREAAYEGYNLLYPHNQGSVYLIDNCGRVINQWDDEGFVPGNSAYLTESGNLVKCKRFRTSAVNDPIWAGGGGEFIEVRSWSDVLVAQIKINDSLQRLHHDIAVMPNGNVLMILWENKSLEEAISAGRDTLLLPQNKLWPEAVFEWDPSLDSIVWKWHVWDHLIQDFDSTKENFGIVSEHPELIDLNYDEHDGHPDWLHANAIDYNPELDQIMLSIPYFNELWIIDHSTSIEEAAGHTGGNSGKGGDLIFRWGNPQTYQHDNPPQQMLHFQHATSWVDPFAEPGDENFSHIQLFNNRVNDTLSTANTLILPWSHDKLKYDFAGNFFGPDQFSTTVTHPTGDSRSVSSGLSSTQVLPNNNFLICAGRWGYSYEVTPSGDLVWEYITPIIRGQIGTQGDTNLTINANLTFRILRYPLDYPAFTNRELMAGNYIELNPDTTICNALTTSVSDIEIDSYRLYPNPSTQFLNIERDHSNDQILEILDMNGKLLRTVKSNDFFLQIDISNLYPGIYYLRSTSGQIDRFAKI